MSVATDPASDIWRGRRVVWKHVPRGGYGFVIRVPVTIRKIHASGRVTIDVEGTGKTAVVSRASLIVPGSMTHVGITAAIETQKGPPR